MMYWNPRRVGEAVRAAEGFRCEPCQVIYMSGHPPREEPSHQEVGEHLVVEKLLETVQGSVTAGMFVKALGPRRVEFVSAMRPATEKSPVRD